MYWSNSGYNCRFPTGAPTFLAGVPFYVRIVGINWNNGDFSALEPHGTYSTLRLPWMCLPVVPETYGCPFTCFISTLGCFGTPCHSPYWWEPPGTMWDSYDSPIWLHWWAGPSTFYSFYCFAVGYVEVDIPFPQYLYIIIFYYFPY